MTTKNIWWLLPLLCLAACSNGANHSQFAKATTDSAGENIQVSDSTLPLNSPERKIIHTADFNCKVKHVMAAVNSLEHMVTAAGGVVEESKMNNYTGETTTLYYKSDSLKKLFPFTTTATLTLKIPVVALDSIIYSIPSLVSFIDSRTLKQTDVTARYKGNEEIVQTGTKVYTKSKAVALAKKADDLIKVQQYEDDNMAQAIERKVSQMELQDAVSYATLTISLTQPEQYYSQIIANPDFIVRVPLHIRLLSAMQNGWDFIISFLVGIINIWPVFLVAILAWIIYKKAKGRKLVPART